MWVSLGYVAVTVGSPNKITSNVQLGGNELVHALFFQQVRTNSGYILVGKSAVNEATGTDLCAVLPLPTTSSLPSATIGIPDSGNPINANEYYIDGTNTGDKCLVSALIL